MLSPRYGERVISMVPSASASGGHSVAGHCIGEGAVVIGPEHVSWARDYAASIAPHATGAEYTNYMAEKASAEELRAVYGGAKFARRRV